MKDNYTDITVVLDRSGSMARTKQDTEGGFNHFIEDQRKLPGECKFTLVQFDTAYESVYRAVPLQEVKPLNLVPRGGTALLDAIGRTINETGARLAAMQEADRPAKVLFVIITDGEENSSKEFNHAQIFGLITQQQDQYQWTFVFIGANQDAIKNGTNMGLSAMNSLAYADNSKGVTDMYGSLSRSTSTLRASGARSTRSFFNPKDQEAPDKVKPVSK